MSFVLFIILVAYLGANFLMAKRRLEDDEPWATVAIYAVFGVFIWLYGKIKALFGK